MSFDRLAIPQPRHSQLLILNFKLAAFSLLLAIHFSLAVFALLDATLSILRSFDSSLLFNFKTFHVIAWK